MISGAERRLSTDKKVIERDGFLADTSKKQISFVQRIRPLFRPHGWKTVGRSPASGYTNAICQRCSVCRWHLRQATWSLENPDGHWRSYDWDELIVRDRVSVDIRPRSRISARASQIDRRRQDG